MSTSGKVCLISCLSSCALSYCVLDGKNCIKYTYCLSREYRRDMIKQISLYTAQIAKSVFRVGTMASRLNLY